MAIANTGALARRSNAKGRSGATPALLVATRKGLWTLRAEPDRRRWSLAGPWFLGHVVTHAVLDPRDGRTLLLATRTGHLGPTVFRSTDGARTWRESARPPAFEAGTGLAVDHVFWLAPAHPSEPDVWYCGTSPQGLFRSEDGGANWSGVAGFNENPQRSAWCGGPENAPPGGARLHSICIDQRDPARMMIGMSSGGVFASQDRGASWRPRNRGLGAYFLPDPDAEYGHDPHCMRQHPLDPDRVYQQNHCGIYRLDVANDRWLDIGRGMPKRVGSVGFPLVLHPRDPQTIWVFPMDGGSVWPRVSPGGKPAAYRSRDAGRSWERLDGGLPADQAWWTVKRQAMCADSEPRVGVYLGTTGGEVWGSRDEGARWRCLARHLPEVLAIEVAYFAPRAPRAKAPRGANPKEGG